MKPEPIAMSLKQESFRDIESSATKQHFSNVSVFSISMFKKYDSLDVNNLPPEIKKDEILETLGSLFKDLSLLGFPGVGGNKFLERVPRADPFIAEEEDNQVYLSECENFRFGSASYDDHMRLVEVI